MATSLGVSKIMSKFFFLGKRPAKKNSHKRYVLPKFDLKTINIVIIALIVIFGIGYLVQVNGLATKGYRIKDLEKRIADLQQEKSDLELNALSLQSVVRVKEKLADLNMVGAGNSEYLQEKPVALAR